MTIAPAARRSSRPRSSSARRSRRSSTRASWRVALDACLELLDRGRVRVAEKKNGQWVVNEWLKKAVLLYFRIHDNAVIDAGYTRFFDKVPLKYADGVGGGAARRRRARRAARDGAQGRLHRARRRADAQLREHRRLRRPRHAWSIPGRRSARARRSAATCICPAASASAACSSRCRRPRPSSRTTVSSARARRSSRASSSRRARSSRWACSSARARASTTAPAATISRAACRQARWSCRAPCPPPTALWHSSCAVIVKRVDAQTRAKTSINELLRGVQ